MQSSYGDLATALLRRDKEGDYASVEEFLQMSIDVTANLEETLRRRYEEENNKIVEKEVKDEEAAEEVAAEDDL